MSRMFIYLLPALPQGSSDLPKAIGPSHRLYSVLLRMGFTYAPHITARAVVSYTAISPLQPALPYHFCCTFLGVASTGRYPASCPVKPGLSSPAPFRGSQPRTPVLLSILLSILYCFTFRLQRRMTYPKRIRDKICQRISHHQKASFPECLIRQHKSS